MLYYLFVIFSFCFIKIVDGSDSDIAYVADKHSLSLTTVENKNDYAQKLESTKSTSIQHFNATGGLFNKQGKENFLKCLHKHQNFSSSSDSEPSSRSLSEKEYDSESSEEEIVKFYDLSNYEKYIDEGCLRQLQNKINEVFLTLKQGIKPRDIRAHKCFATINGKRYTVFHCGLSDRYRLYYAMLSENVCVVVAIANHDYSFEKKQFYVHGI